MHKLKYIDKVELYNEWKKWRETNTLSPNFVNILFTIADGVARKMLHDISNLYDDYIQEAMLKMHKNLHNLKEEKRDAFFAYLNLAARTALLEVTGKVKRQADLKERIRQEYHLLSASTISAETQNAIDFEEGE